MFGLESGRTWSHSHATEREPEELADSLGTDGIICAYCLLRPLLRVRAIPGLLGNSSVASAVVFIGLEGPTPPQISTVVLMWVLSTLSNILLYVAIGALCWGILRLARRLR